MAIRLGTQNWINPAPFAAAAEMTVEAGRAEGQMYANIGQGINKAVSGYEAKKERDRSRQDALDQRGIDNARADRAEARVVAEGKLDFLQKNVAASQIEFEMMRTRYEMDGSSESEAAMNQSAQKVKTAIDLYKMGLGTHGGVVQPHGAPTTDYVGVGNGVAVNGKPTSQMTDTELDDLMAKSERGEVDYTYRGGATGDMGQGVGGATVRPRAASPEVGSFTFPAEVDTADEYAQVASQLLAEAALVESSAGHLKPSSRAASAAKGRAAVLRQRAAFANFRAGTLADEAKATREQAEKVAEEQRKAAADNAALRKLVNPETGAPYLSMAEPDLPAAAASILINNAKVAGGAEARLPSQMALQGQRASDALAKQDDQQKFVMEKMAKAQEYAQTRMAQAKQNRMDIAAEARAAGIPMDQFKTLFSEIDALSGQQQQLFGRAQDLADMGRMGEAQAVLNQAQNMDGDLNEMMRQLRDARLKIGQGAPAAKSIDPTTARSIFDREVKARGIDPDGPEAEQLVADIKAGKVR